MAAPHGTLAAHLYTSATPLSDIAGSADAIGDFQGLTISTEVALITNFGDYGRVFTSVPFQSVAEGRTYKLKGGYDDGEIQLMLGQDLSDAGQAALKAYAEASDQNTYPFKITFTGASASYDTVYFGAKVMSFRTQMGGLNDVVRAMVSLNINTTIYTGAS